MTARTRPFRDCAPLAGTGAGTTTPKTASQAATTRTHARGRATPSTLPLMSLARQRAGRAEQLAEGGANDECWFGCSRRHAGDGVQAELPADLAAASLPLSERWRPPARPSTALARQDWSRLWMPLRPDRKPAIWS